MNFYNKIGLNNIAIFMWLALSVSMFLMAFYATGEAWNPAPFKLTFLIGGLGVFFAIFHYLYMDDEKTKRTLFGTNKNNSLDK